VLAGLVVALVGLLGPACPTRNLEVQVTAAGADTLVVGCETFRSACVPDGGCHKNHLLCTQDTCQLRQACTLGKNPDWSADQTMGMRVLLVELSTGADVVKSASGCVPLNLRPCILDTGGVNGCPCIENPLGPETCKTDPSGAATLACIRDTIAQALEHAMPDGETFSGFKSTDNVSLVIAFYNAQKQATCDGGALVNPNDCAVANLTAVAGMAAPIGSTAFDITCVSCQGGPHGAVGPDNAPCPATMNACFLQRVAAALTAGGF
jgi:hypothetical protein